MEFKPAPDAERIQASVERRSIRALYHYTPWRTG